MMSVYFRGAIKKNVEFKNNNLKQMDPEPPDSKTYY